MQSHKKEGLEQNQLTFFCEQTRNFRSGIPKAYVLQSQIQISHLACGICQQIIWKPIACSQQNCFANYCQNCIQNLQSDTTCDSQNHKKCPKCLKTFQKTSIPLINNLLSGIVFKCSYHVWGCQQIVPYDRYLKHTIDCPYQKVVCEGCHGSFLKKEIEQHKQECSFIMVSCPKCDSTLTQRELKLQHTPTQCLQGQLAKKTQQVKNLQSTVQQLRGRLNACQIVVQKVIRGQTIALHVQFYSSFPYNFTFQNNQARLTKASWNQIKQKFDFLHFYLTAPIKTQSPVGFHWRINVKSLRGNLLIGICSSLSTNSVDFVINRFGQIKKKQSNENKYKLIRKSGLAFGQGDSISFRYLALRKVLRIENETRKMESRLEGKEIAELGQNLYSFYSLDTINDCIRFV